MSTTSYYYNLIPFTPLEGELCLYFTQAPTANAQRIHHKLLPKAVVDHYTNEEGLPEHSYCYFTEKVDEADAFHLKIETLSPRFLVRYYSWYLQRYFQEIGHPVKIGFTHEVEVFIPQPREQNEQFDVYDKFSLKVKHGSVTAGYSIILSYLGQSKVFKKDCVALVQDVPSEHFNWVIHKKDVIKWSHLRSQGNIDQHQVHAVLNKSLERGLSIAVQHKRNTNPFKNYHDRILDFHTQYFQDDALKPVIQLDPAGFMAVPTSNVFKTHYYSNVLSFGDGHQEQVPKFALKQHAPFEGSSHDPIQVFFILHQDDIQSAKKIKDQFDNGFHSFKGLYEYVGLFLNAERNFSIVFTDKENPLPEIREGLFKREFKADVTYVCIYLTPYDKDEDDEKKQAIYYQVKELLLQRQITSQVINPAKMKSLGDNWKYSLPNIAIALLAKLDGVPWKLAHEVRPELIIGIGAFYSMKDDVRYVGSSFSFQNDGRFKGFEYFQNNDIDLLAGSISASIREFTQTYHAPQRLIIHFYKTMSQKELRRIMRELKTMELSIPVHIVSINKTESRDIVAFDRDWHHRLPMSGTIIKVGQHEYLLFNNTRYHPQPNYLSDGYPFPIKIKLDSSEPGVLEDKRIVKGLIDQVYQFSRMYWKSLRQQNLPVTIKYPEMVAQIAPHFENTDIPPFGKRNLWFL